MNTFFTQTEIIVAVIGLVGIWLKTRQTRVKAGDTEIQAPTPQKAERLLTLAQEARRQKPQQRRKTHVT